MPEKLELFPSMVRNWTADRLVIAPRDVELTAAREAELVERLGLALDAHGHAAVDEFPAHEHRPAVGGGRCAGWTGAIEAAHTGRWPRR